MERIASAASEISDYTITRHTDGSAIVTVYLEKHGTAERNCAVC